MLGRVGGGNNCTLRARSSRHRMGILAGKIPTGTLRSSTTRMNIFFFLYRIFSISDIWIAKCPRVLSYDFYAHILIVPYFWGASFRDQL